MKKMDNKGFSLVELIIVIAIMAILVGVLAPTFMKYVDQSRRSSDISTAEEIRQAVLADISDDLNGDMYTTSAATEVSFAGGSCTASEALNGEKATSISTEPVGRASIAKDKPFLVTYDTTTGECSVSIDTSDGKYVLTDPTGSANYKAGLAP